MDTTGSRIKRLGIIGTAGRRNDTANMSLRVYQRMCDAARAVIRARGYTHLISGGAAWADHVAVRIALEGDLIRPDRLTLHVPSNLRNGRYDERDRDGNVSNHYHRMFSDKTGFNSSAELAEVQRLGATVHVNALGFKARNSDVARDSTGLLAFTFGTGVPWTAEIHGPSTNAMSAMLNSAGTGTVDTWNKSRAAEKIHVTITKLDDNSGSDTGRQQAPSSRDVAAIFHHARQPRRRAHSRQF